jgi:hypothetical protein
MQLTPAAACEHLKLVWRYFAIQQAQAVIAFRIDQINANRAEAGQPPIKYENESTPY